MTAYNGRSRGERNMSLHKMKWIFILLPPVMIGSFEYIRHGWLLDYLSMEDGNLYITVLTFIISYIVTTWLFHLIEKTNGRLASEQARRAVLEERERLASELHDSIAQMLFYLNVRLKQGKTEEARAVISDLDHHLRQAIFNLRTSPEQSASFDERIRTWVREWSLLTGIEAESRVDGRANEFFDKSEQIALFAIIQEAFTNIRKHSGATEASLDLTISRDDTWTLVVKDNGTGISDHNRSKDHYGLSLMDKRARGMGAVLDIRTVGAQADGPAEEGRRETGTESGTGASFGASTGASSGTNSGTVITINGTGKRGHAADDANVSDSGRG